MLNWTVRDGGKFELEIKNLDFRGTELLRGISIVIDFRRILHPSPPPSPSPLDDPNNIQNKEILIATL